MWSFGVLSSVDSNGVDRDAVPSSLKSEVHRLLDEYSICIYVYIFHISLFQQGELLVTFIRTNCICMQIFDDKRQVGKALLLVDFDDANKQLVCMSQ